MGKLGRDALLTRFRQMVERREPIIGGRRRPAS
jgi:hypothetical protein